ncbi:MAG: hypothetical protein FD143_1469 [Ignavibacteria bacterium]|nr:MAG: hypothetical protein FD143_1469 [Ignavibacteria bacterium]KAF0160519.1 MAG: hypothetical protein FD188_1693 [Ignavibacteria bacterium]
MVFEKLIHLLNTHKKEIATAYYEQVKNSEYMKTYHSLEPEKVIAREEATYVHLAQWLQNGSNNDDAEKFFEKVGSVRYKEGFPLSEINYALFISKKAFYEFSRNYPELLNDLTPQEIIDSFAILGNYFALGGFYMIRGYLNTLFEKLDINDSLTREEIHQILVRGAFDEEDIDMSDFIWRHV